MISIHSFTENMIKMCNRRSYRSLASAASVLLVLLLAITLAVSPTHGGSPRCAYPDGTQKGKGCKKSEECVYAGIGNDRPRCRTLSDGCKRQCKDGYVCVATKNWKTKCEKLVYQQLN